ncbi:hypothetical protein [Mycolicibacterium grossiae]|nr:hypothetical protein [Mycolicibacterium grossiae]
MTIDMSRHACTEWCTVEGPDHGSDPACWGPGHHQVALTLEDGYPHDASSMVEAFRGDCPKIGVYAYRPEVGRVERVKLHLYRPSDNDYRYLDDELHLTVAEVHQLRAKLKAVLAELGGAR